MYKNIIQKLVYIQNSINPIAFPTSTTQIAEALTFSEERLFRRYTYFRYPMKILQRATVQAILPLAAEFEMKHSRSTSIQATEKLAGTCSIRNRGHRSARLCFLAGFELVPPCIGQEKNCSLSPPLPAENFIMTGTPPIADRGRTLLERSIMRNVLTTL